jgi:hypothetical protein
MTAMTVARLPGRKKDDVEVRVARRRLARGQRIRRDAPEPDSDVLQESLEESFPASDPPSWTVIIRLGKPA